MSGVWKTRENRLYAVAQFPEDALPKSRKDVQMTIFPVLGSAKGRPLYLKYSHPDNKIILDFSEIDQKPVELKIKSLNQEDICGEGQAGIKSISICYGRKRLDLEVIDLLGEVEFEIHLKRGLSFSEPLNSSVTLDEALGRARFNHYSVMQEAEKLFRSREEIHIAKAALVPHLTGLSILSIALLGVPGGTGPFSIYQIADSFLPFIFPSNWYRLSEKKESFQAQRASFVSLQANQMLATQLLFYSLQRDQEFIEKAQVRMEELLLTQDEVKIQKDLGLLDDHEVEEFEKRVIQFSLDLALLRSHFVQELSLFAHSLAYHSLPDKSFTFVPESLAGLAMEYPSVPTAQVIFENSKSYSLELRTLRFLKEAAHIQTKSEKFSFLMPGAFIFLDASYLSRNRMVLSMEKEIEIKTDETVSILEQKSVEMASKISMAYLSIQETKKTLELDRHSLARLSLPSGFKNGHLKEIEDARDQVYLSETKWIESIYLLLATQAVLDRLTLSGVYENLRLLD